MENQTEGKMQELFNFMLNKLGGEDSVRSEFLRNKISGLDADSITIGGLFDEAEKSGWSEWLRSLKVMEFAQMVGGKSPVEKSAPTRSGKRMTHREKGQLHDAILNYLKDNPWSRSSALARIVSLPTRTIGLHLKTLREQGLVKAEGEKAKMRYTLV